jgi:hypothetical protein
MAADVMASPVSDRLTVTALLLLTFATGLVDAVSLPIFRFGPDRQPASSTDG